MVQSGETRRFIDEIEYLLDGIQNPPSSNTKPTQFIVSSLQEIIEKCFDPSTNKLNVNFSMKLKSHGALGIIFESLQSESDPRILDLLVVLVVGLLYDVRRIDFFFKPDLALKLAEYCFLDSGSGPKERSIDILKASQLFTSDTTPNTSVYEYVGIWILYKWTFSSLTTTNNSSFFGLLKEEQGILNRIISIIKERADTEIGKKTAGLLDYLIINGIIDLKKYSKDLVGLLLKENMKVVTFMKLAVSITGSPLFGKGSELTREEFFELIQLFTEASSSFEDISGNTSKAEESSDLPVLALSCLINLIDRCSDSFIDEFRYQKCKNSSKLSLLEFFTEAAYDKDNEYTSTLLALLLGFICRQNRTNLQVMLSCRPSSPTCSLKKEIFTVASNFYLQQEKSMRKAYNSDSGHPKEKEDAEIIAERLNEIILMFK